MYGYYVSACMSMYYMYVWCLWRLAESIRCPGTGVVSSELPHGCWESHLGPLEEQPVLTTAKPWLQLQQFYF